MVACPARCSPIIALVLACFAFATVAQSSTLRFDGVYRAPVQPPPRWPVKPTKELFLYFRFYPDGSVVSLLSTGTPMEVAKFIRRNLEESGNGDLFYQRRKATLPSYYSPWLHHLLG